MPGEERQRPDDAELIRLTAAGDRRAFALLVERHHGALYRFLGGVTRDDAAAEDALQDAFAAAWQGAAGFRGEASGRSWLYTLARNALYRRYRRHDSRPELSESLDELGAAAGWGDPSSGDCVLRSLEDRERVRKAMTALAPDDREILVLLDVEELSAREAAEVLGQSVPAVKSRLHRARLRLLAALREEGSDGR